jgi:hypothetical protein
MVCNYCTGSLRPKEDRPTMDGNSEHPQMTAGLDLGDRYSYLCLIDQKSGEVMEEGRLRTTPEALKRSFASERPMRIAIEAASCKYAPRCRHLRLHTSMEKGVSHKVACTSLIHQSADHLM